MASLAARCCAPLGTKCQCIEPVPAGLRSLQMTSEELDHVVRAMILVVESLEVGPAKESMQEKHSRKRLLDASNFQVGVWRQFGDFTGFIDDPKPTLKRSIVRVR